MTIFSCLLTLLVGACGKIGLGAANAPAHFATSLNVTRDVAFSQNPDLSLDVYAPKNAGNKLPVMVFFYGGKWEMGKRQEYAFAGQAFAQKGYVVVIPDYRKYPDVKFPAFVDDGAKAVAWTQKHIADYGGNPDRIFLSGHSAGAHIASLIASDARYLQRAGSNRDVVKAFAGLAGPYDFTPDEDDLKDMFGPPENYPQMQATTFIDGHQPPMLLLWGADDKAVGRMNLDRLEAKIKAKGGVVETKIYPKTDHIWIVASLTWFGRNHAPVIDDVTNFFNSIR